VSGDLFVYISGTFARLDADTLTPKSSYRHGSFTPGLMLVYAGRIWSISSLVKPLLVIDFAAPGGALVLGASISLGARANDLSLDPGRNRLYVLTRSLSGSEGWLARIDAGLDLYGPWHVQDDPGFPEGAVPGGIAYDRATDRLMVGCATGLFACDPETLEPQASLAGRSYTVSGFTDTWENEHTVDGELWLPEGNTLRRVDTTTLTVTGSWNSMSLHRLWLEGAIHDPLTGAFWTSDGGVQKLWFDRLALETAATFLIGRAKTSGDAQERAHAVNGLRALDARPSAEQQAMIGPILAAAATSSDDPVRYAATDGLPAAHPCNLWLRAGLAGRSRGTASGRRQGEGRTRAQGGRSRSAGQLPLPLRRSRGCRSDPQRGGRPRHRPAGRLRGRTGGFEALRQAYEALGTPPGSVDGALEHVRLLRAMGRTHVPAAVAYLEERFDRLAHGNMRIAAAESLLELTGRFGQQSLAELRKLANLSSSVYRTQVIEMLLRNASAIDAIDPAEQQQLVAILAQINVTSDAAERGLLLDALSRFAPDLARRRAMSMTFASRRADRLEGIERLWNLWGAADR